MLTATAAATSSRRTFEPEGTVVDSDVTITITVGPRGAVSGAAIGAAGGAEQTALPTPMALDALQVASAGEVPRPVDPAELAATTGVQVATQEQPPEPIPIERLTASTASAAPPPVDVGTLASVSGPPAPLSLEELDAATGENDTPTPSKRSRPSKQ
jgi:hypothetical protein